MFKSSLPYYQNPEVNPKEKENNVKRNKNRNKREKRQKVDFSHIFKEIMAFSAEFESKYGKKQQNSS